MLLSVEIVVIAVADDNKVIVHAHEWNNIDKTRITHIIQRLSVVVVPFMLVQPFLATNGKLISSNDAKN